VVEMEFFLVGKSNEAMAGLHAISMCADMMMLLVVKGQTTPRRVELIASAHLVTDVAKMVLNMHVLKKLILAIKIPVAKLAAGMGW